MTEIPVNILCIRLDTIDDVLMTAPAIRAYEESSAPSDYAADITLVVVQLSVTSAGDQVIVYN